MEEDQEEEEVCYQAACQERLQEDRKDSGNKYDRGEDKPISFLAATMQSAFYIIALSMIANASLCVTKAVQFL